MGPLAATVRWLPFSAEGGPQLPWDAAPGRGRIRAILPLDVSPPQRKGPAFLSMLMFVT